MTVVHNLRFAATPRPGGEYVSGMRNPRFTLLVWSIYVLALGASLFLIPEPVLDLLGIDAPAELWPVRVVGAAVALLGIYYFAGTVANHRAFYSWTVFGRLVVAGMLAALAITDAPWQLWIIAVLDALGALWTLSAMRPEREPVHGETAPGTVSADPGEGV